jgi:type IX secretion system PorP/SprF family membrane protein
MIMKKILSVLTLILIAGSAFAQQDPLYAQYINNPMVINPAYAGLNNNLNASISYRNQWGGFEGNPATINFNSHISLLENKIGAGLLLVQDQIGNSKNTEFQGAFAYKLPVSDETTLSFGMQAGFINFRSNVNDLNLADPDDPAFLQNENVTKPNLGAGVILKSERYLMGLSIPRLLNSTITTGGEQFQLYNRTVYLFGAYVFYLNQNIRLKPSVLLRGVSGSPVSVDLNFNLNFYEKFSAGIFTRNFNSYGLQLQAKLGEKLKFGYTFELPTNSSVGPSFTTHELFLGLTMPTFDYHDRSFSNF